jgi:hypothetical protein
VDELAKGWKMEQILRGSKDVVKSGAAHSQLSFANADYKRHLLNENRS